MGLFRRYHLLHYYIGLRRPYCRKFQKFYDLDGISIPQPFCQSFTPFAILINKALDKIPGFSKLEIDAEGMKKKFGVIGEPLVLGVIVGMLIGWAAQLDIKKVLFLGITMGAVMELIPASLLCLSKD